MRLLLLVLLGGFVLDLSLASARAQTVNPPQLLGLAGAGTVDLGQRVTFAPNVGGSVSTTGWQYQWRKNGTDISGATTSNYVILSAVADDAGTYAVAVSNAGGTSVASGDLVVRPLSPIVFTTQPRATVVQVGQSASFFFVATGSFPRTYQWRKDGVAIAGATLTSYSINVVTTADAGAYSVVVSNSEGSVTSATAALTVNAATPLVLASFAPGDITVEQGTTAQLGISISSGSSPFTYQWLKNGVAIAGSTRGNLTWDAITLADAGRYSVVVTNVLGSATSREATVVVTPARPIVITRQPGSDTVPVGASAGFSVGISGSSPVTYQWLKNGEPIANARNDFYTINQVTLSDAASYSVTVTNAAGSVTSANATLTVTPAEPPAITRQPVSQTVSYGGNATFSVEVTGSRPLTFLWTRDGTRMGDSPSINLAGLTPANSGTFQVTITNIAGSVTSTPVTLTVLPANAPRITRQPASISLTPGLSGSVWVEVDSTVGVGSVTFQWFKNGVPIPGATSATRGFDSPGESDAGDYQVVVTGPGGSITSSAARVTILPPAPPFSRSWPFDQSASIGSSTGFSVGASPGSGLDGSPPFTYQWFKDGAPIPGATSWGLNFQRVTLNDYGVYSVTIANEGGIISSPPLRLRPELALVGAASWFDAARLGDVVYFLSTTPARIDRYDLASERWLPSVALGTTQTPTAFLPTVEGVYIAYGRALARRSPDLGSEVTVANSTNQIDNLFAWGDWLYYQHSGSSLFARIQRSTLTAGSELNTRAFPSRAVGIANGLQQGFVPGSFGGVATFPILSDGTFGAVVESSYLQARLSHPVRTPYIFPNERWVGDETGAVYDARSLAYVGALGEPFADLAFAGGTTAVALRGNMLTAYSSDSLLESGRAKVPIFGRRVFGRGSSLYVFGDATAPGGEYAVSKTDQSALVPEASGFIAAPATRYSIEDAFVSNDGVVHVFSRSVGGIVRWSTSTRTYLPTIRLRRLPLLAHNQPGRDRLLLAYPDGVLTQLALGAGSAAESVIGNVSNRPYALGDLNEFAIVHTNTNGSSATAQIVIGPNGQTTYLAESSSGQLSIVYDSTRRRLFTEFLSYDRTLHYETVTVGGTLTTNSPQPFLLQVSPPIRLNPESTLIASGNGRIISADLASVGALANDVADAAWLSSALFTIREVNQSTQLQRWSRVNYLQTGTLTVPGAPIRIFRLSDAKLVVISNQRGFATFTVVNSDLSVEEPPRPSSFAGVYFASLSGVADELAFYVRDDRTAVLLAHLPTSRTGLLASNITVNADGTFLVGAAELGTTNTRTVRGSIGTDGTLTGIIATLDATFTGARVQGSRATSGYFRSLAINGKPGVAHTIVGGDGKTLTLAQVTSGVDGGVGQMDPAGRTAIATARGATLAVTIDNATGQISASADRDLLAGILFAGLREDVAHTDRLANISTRGQAGSGDDSMIAGFVINGDAPRPVLIRGIGPTLGTFGINGAMADPRLRLFRGDTMMAESDNWGFEAAAANIVAVSVQVGAFPLASTSRDAVILTTLPPGNYTAQVSANGAGGVGLVEVYDAGGPPVTGAPKLINIATRGRVGTGDDVLIAGIVVSGNAPKRLLVRAVGPTLGTFGVTGTLPDPVLTILSGSSVLTANDDWSSGGASSAMDIATAAASVGAFPLTFGSRDATLLLTLLPGNYTAQVSGKGSVGGIALIEVYEVNQ